MKTFHQIMEFAEYPSNFVPDLQSDFLESLILANMHVEREEKDWFDEYNSDLNLEFNGKYEKFPVNEFAIIHDDQLSAMDEIFSKPIDQFFECHDTQMLNQQNSLESAKWNMTSSTTRVQHRSTCPIPGASALLEKALKMRPPSIFSTKSKAIE
jgi:hypothetical protein